MTQVYQYKVLKNYIYNGKKYYCGQEFISTEYITGNENFFLVKSLLKAVNNNTILKHRNI